MRGRIEQILDSFESIVLEKTNKVRFLNRCDFKYILSLDDLGDILQELKEYYYVLFMRDSRIHDYRTTYFDTDDDYFYLMHHGGRNNRFKVRKREYKSTNERFFEIKKKNLAGQTKKKRIETLSTTNEDIDEVEMAFMNRLISKSLPPLQPKVDTLFSRITLVSKQFNERVTIDLDLSFQGVNGDLIETRNFTVVEVKCNKHTERTIIRQALKKHGIRPTGFSKYCIGRVLTNDTLKYNQFKQKIRFLKRTGLNYSQL